MHMDTEVKKIILKKKPKKLTLEEKLEGLSLTQRKDFIATYQNSYNDIIGKEVDNILPIKIEEGKDSIQFYFSDHANFYARKKIGNTENGNTEIIEPVKSGVVKQLKCKLIMTYITENYNNPHNWQIHMGKTTIEGTPEDKKYKAPKVLVNY